MIKVKSYRPFITENLIWDFPSRFKLNAASEFMDQNLAEVTDFISETAKETMKNEGVYWFVEDKANHKILALISLKNIDFDNNSATINITFADNISEQFGNEIIQRLFVFIHDQISLNELQIEEIPSKVSKFFTLNGYTLNNNKLKRM